MLTDERKRLLHAFILYTLFKDGVRTVIKLATVRYHSNGNPPLICVITMQPWFTRPQSGLAELKSEGCEGGDALFWHSEAICTDSWPLNDFRHAGSFIALPAPRLLADHVNCNAGLECGGSPTQTPVSSSHENSHGGNAFERYTVEPQRGHLVYLRRRTRPIPRMFWFCYKRKAWNIVSILCGCKTWCFTPRQESRWCEILGFHGSNE